MGDFNFWPESPLYDRMVGPFAPSFGRLNNLDGFVDAWVASGHKENEGITCFSGTIHDHKRIDFCFVSTPLAPHIRRTWIDTEADGSDHQPIWTEIDL